MSDEGPCWEQGVDGGCGLQLWQCTCECLGWPREEVCSSRAESKVCIWKLALFLDIYSLLWSNRSHAFPVRGPLGPNTLFSLPSFLIQKAACFGKVCLGLHCTHLFAMNEKHFSFSLNYCCQIPCVHMLQAILQRELANLQNWCSRLRQLKWASLSQTPAEVRKHRVIALCKISKRGFSSAGLE